MKLPPALVLVPALLLLPGWAAPAGAQAPRAGSPNAVVAERNAVELRQGMSLEEVAKLLGKPRRTALKNAELQWTYVWAPERSLHVVFAAKTPEQWVVNGWDWSAY
jgi:hypothetical protein